jgi:hypothetical protein
MASRLLRAENENARLFFEKSSHEILTQVPEFRNLRNREVPHGITWGLGRRIRAVLLAIELERSCHSLIARLTLLGFDIFRTSCSLSDTL